MRRLENGLPTRVIALTVIGLLAGSAAAAPDEIQAQRLVDTTTDQYTFGGSRPGEFTRVGELVFFKATTRYTGRELFVTDGTEDGTRVVVELVPGAVGSAPHDLIASDGSLFFRATTAGRGTGAWRTDGTPEGTVPVDEMPSPPAPSPLVAGSDDVRDLEFFSGETNLRGYELFRTDGTQRGTYLVKDIYPGEGSGNPSKFTRVGDVVFFEANTPDEGYELWKTDGTEDGTELVKDVRPGPNWGATDALTNFEDRLLLFTGWDEDHAAELWRSDGTEDGTYLVKDLATRVNAAGNSDAGRPHDIVDVGDGTAYFAAATELALIELWRTDGTADGTYLVADIEPDYRDGHVEGVLAIPGGALFTASRDPGPAGRVLWTTDGTPGGTALVDEAVVGDSVPRALSRHGDTAIGQVGNTGFFDSGGVAGPATLTQLPLPEQWSFAGFPFTPLGDRALFTIERKNYGRQLWITDGTEGGTALVAYGSNDAREIDGDWAYVGDEVYFPQSLTRTDGTPEGTEYFFEPFDDLENPNSIAVVGDRVLFVAESRATGLHHVHAYSTATDESSALHTIDVRQFKLSHTRQLRSLWGVGGCALLMREGADELWKTDGTAAGTFKVADVVPGWDMELGEYGDVAPVRVGARVLFSAITPEHGLELWRLDDGELGSTLVADIAPGAADSRPNGLVPLGSSDFAVFAASDPAHGMELWITDGTEAGTHLLSDVLPGPQSSNPRHITVSGSDVLFAADGDEAGTEPWVVSLAGLDLTESARDGGTTLPEGAPVGVVPEPLDLDRVRMKLNFRRRGRDRIVIRGKTKVPTDLDLTGAYVVVEIQDQPHVFVLAENGRSKNGKNRLRMRMKKGVDVGEGSLAVPFDFLLKGDFQASLSEAGLTPDAGSQTIARSVRISMLLGPAASTQPVMLDYQVRRRRGKAVEQRP